MPERDRLVVVIDRSVRAMDAPDSLDHRLARIRRQGRSLLWEIFG
jgi:hypothetical protein